MSRLESRQTQRKDSRGSLGDVVIPRVSISLDSRPTSPEDASNRFLDIPFANFFIETIDDVFPEKDEKFPVVKISSFPICLSF